MDEWKGAEMTGSGAACLNYRGTLERRRPLKSRIGIGVYGVQEAARLSGVNGRTAGRWCSGDGQDQGRRRIRPDLASVDGRYAVSFHDLIDLVVVGKLRRLGVPFGTIWKCYVNSAKYLDTKHPFCHARLLTDGREIFREFLDQSGEKQLEDAISRQGAISKILRPFLDHIDYEAEIAARWRIAPGVVVDPDHAFGKPIVADVGIATHVLASAYWANNESFEFVADLFETSVEAVQQAVAFEERLKGGRPFDCAA